MKDNPKTPPFCMNCKSFMQAPEIKPKTDEPFQPRCLKFPMLDVVFGERFFVPCEAIRAPDAPCGIEGKLFQPKPVIGSEPEATGLN